MEDKTLFGLLGVLALFAFLSFLGFMVWQMRQTAQGVITTADIERARAIARGLE